MEKKVWHVEDGRCCICRRKVESFDSKSGRAQRLGGAPGDPKGPAVSYCRKCWSTPKAGEEA